MWRFARLVLCLLATFAGCSVHAANVDLEIAMDRGVAIDAQQRWVRLLSRAGIDDLRIRQARSDEKPRIENRGTAQDPNYKVIGLLLAGERLHLPGARFSARDVSRLKEYLRRVGEEGVEGVTAARGAFNLTRGQIAQLEGRFRVPLEQQTLGETLRKFIAHCGQRARMPVHTDSSAQPIVEAAKPIHIEADPLSLGTALTIVLRQEGLYLEPESRRGDLALRITASQPNQSKRDRDALPQVWPVGWKPEEPLNKVVPVMFQFLNIEIDGFTLSESLDAIKGRIDIPFYFDSHRMKQQAIDPDKIQVKFPRQKTYYKRVLNHILFQAKLKGDIRIDESGTPFFWITTVKK